MTGAAALLRAVLCPPHAPPDVAVPDPESTLPPLLHGFRLLDLDAPGTEAPAALGLSPRFLAALRSGDEVVRAMREAVILARLPQLRPRAISPRGLDVAHALARRGKLLLCPFTGDWTGTAKALGHEVFWHAAGGRACLVAQWAAAPLAAQDTAWIFPAERVVLFLGHLLGSPDYLRYMLGEALLGLLRAPELVAAHLRRVGPPPQMLLVETIAPHLGHCIWNAASAWPRLLEQPGLPRPDGIVTWEGNDFLPPPTALWPDLAGLPLHRLQRPADLVGLVAGTGGLALVAKDDWIGAGFAGRVLAWARAALPPDRAAALAALRAQARPLVLLGLRLGNRAWVEQEEGLADLAAALAARFPGIGFVLDGLTGGTAMGWTHGLMSLEAEAALAGRLAARIGTHSPCHVTVGRGMVESLAASAAVDLFVAPLGTGLAKYQWLANRPGVVLSNRLGLDRADPRGWALRVFDGCRDDARPAVMPDPALVRDIPAPDRPGPGQENFSLDWRHVLPLALPLAEAALRR